MRISKSTNIEASTTDVLEPTVDNVLDLIENKKIIFKNDVAYWSRGKRVLPKEYRDCIYETQYAHWLNEWSCEQAEKFGDRAYYDYDGDTEVKASNMRITKATKSSVKASKKVCASQDRRVIYDKDGIKVSTTGRNYDFIATIENDTDEEYCVEELGLCVPAHDWAGFLADDEGYADLGYFKSLGRVKACGDVKASTSTDKALQHIKAAIDILGKSGNKDAVTKDSIANLATVMFDIKASTIVAGESIGEYKGYTIYKDDDAGYYYIYTQSKGEGRMDFESDREAEKYIDRIFKED